MLMNNINNNQLKNGSTLVCPFPLPYTGQSLQLHSVPVISQHDGQLSLSHVQQQQIAQQQHNNLQKQQGHMVHRVHSMQSVQQPLQRVQSVRAIESNGGNQEAQLMITGVFPNQFGPQLPQLSTQAPRRVNVNVGQIRMQPVPSVSSVSSVSSISPVNVGVNSIGARRINTIGSEIDALERVMGAVHATTNINGCDHNYGNNSNKVEIAGIAQIPQIPQTAIVEHGRRNGNAYIGINNTLNPANNTPTQASPQIMHVQVIASPIESQHVQQVRQVQHIHPVQRVQQVQQLHQVHHVGQAQVQQVQQVQRTRTGLHGQLAQIPQITNVQNVQSVQSCPSRATSVASVTSLGTMGSNMNSMNSIHSLNNLNNLNSLNNLNNLNNLSRMNNMNINKNATSVIVTQSLAQTPTPSTVQIATMSSPATSIGNNNISTRTRTTVPTMVKPAREQNNDIQVSVVDLINSLGYLQKTVNVGGNINDMGMNVNMNMRNGTKLNVVDPVPKLANGANISNGCDLTSLPILPNLSSLTNLPTLPHDKIGININRNTSTQEQGTQQNFSGNIEENGQQRLLFVSAAAVAAAQLKCQENRIENLSLNLNLSPNTSPSLKSNTSNGSDSSNSNTTVTGMIGAQSINNQESTTLSQSTSNNRNLMVSRQSKGNNINNNNNNGGNQTCPHCNKRFARKWNLKEHIRVHTRETPFVCDICDKGFTQQHCLKEHKRIHTGEKPFKCHLCPKRFAAKGNLSAHKRIHTGEKPHQCKICLKKFTQKGTLNRHMRTIHLKSNNNNNNNKVNSNQSKNTDNGNNNNSANNSPNNNRNSVIGTNNRW